MRILYVGDMHVTPEELADCQSLANLILRVVEDDHVERVVFLGDQYHTHGIVRVEVMGFWKRFLFELCGMTKVTMLVGNHDKPNDSAIEDHALMAHGEDVQVVSVPQDIARGIVAVPHMHDNEAFVETCNRLSKGNTLICHQTFDGGKYENGSYMKDGVDQKRVPQASIISGHIHTPQAFGKVWYVGAPRWRSLADAAATDRSIWVVDHDADGAIGNKKEYDTGLSCSKILYTKLTPDNADDLPDVKEKDRWYVDIHGPVSFVNEKAEFCRARGARVRKFPTSRREAKVKESDGVHTAFGKYVDAFDPPNKTPKETLRKVVHARVEQ